MGPSKTPTKAEREWMKRITDYGCCACRKHGIEDVPASVHHIISGNRRMGHLFTLPLCYSHHQGGGLGGIPSVHQAKRTFEKKYGTELELLAGLQVELGLYDKVIT